MCTDPIYMSSILYTEAQRKSEMLSRRKGWNIKQSDYRDSEGASQVVLVVKNPRANTGDNRERCAFDPWVRKIPWRRTWQPFPVFLPGEPHGHEQAAVHGCY